MLGRKLLNERKKLRQTNKKAHPITKQQHPKPQKKTFAECIKEKYNYRVKPCHNQLYRVFGTNKLLNEETVLTHLSALTDTNSMQIEKAYQFVGLGDGNIECSMGDFEKLVRSHVAGNSGKRPGHSPFLSTSDSLNCDFMQGLGNFLNQEYEYVHLLELDKTVLGNRVIDASFYCSSSNQGILHNRAKGAGEFLIVGEIPTESISNVHTFQKTANTFQPTLVQSLKFRQTQTFQERLDEQRKQASNTQLQQAKLILESMRQSGK